MASYRIVKLDDSWKGKTRLFRYRTDSYLDVQITEEPGVSRIEFRQKMFDTPIEKELEVTWMEDFMHAPMLFAAASHAATVKVVPSSIFLILKTKYTFLTT